jgi:hypothetical protein
MATSDIEPGNVGTARITAQTFEVGVDWWHFFALPLSRTPGVVCRRSVNADEWTLQATSPAAAGEQSGREAD